jgi:hypothetical protein
MSNRLVENQTGKVTMRNLSKPAMIFVAVAALGIAVSAHAEKMYQWTDENGVVHFSDKKPQGQDFKTVDVPTAPTTGTVSPIPPGTDQAAPSAAQQRRDEIAQSRQQSREKQAANEAQCAAWQAEVDRLEPHRRVFFTNEEGETERMDDVERTNTVAELKKKIAENCK